MCGIYDRERSKEMKKLILENCERLSRTCHGCGKVPVNIYEKSGKGIMDCSVCGAYIRTMNRGEMEIANEEYLKAKAEKEAKAKTKEKRVLIDVLKTKNVEEMTKILTKLVIGLDEVATDEELEARIRRWLTKEI